MFDVYVFRSVSILTHLFFANDRLLCYLAKYGILKPVFARFCKFMSL